jgi:uncharacterized protein YceK
MKSTIALLLLTGLLTLEGCKTVSASKDLSQQTKRSNSASMRYSPKGPRSGTASR